MSTPIPPLLTLTVLVVDDDPAVRRVLARELEQAGYRVLTAADGLEALTVLAESGIEIHLVVCDLIMPELDGYQFAARLETLPYAPEIIFMSAFRSDLELDHPTLTKPFHPTDLSAAVRRLLERRLKPMAEDGLKGA